MIPWDTSYSLMTLLWRMLVLWVGSLLGCWHCLQCGRGPAMLVCAGSSWQSPPLLLASASPALAPVTLTIPWLGPALAPATSLAIDAIVPWSPHSHFSWPHSLPSHRTSWESVCRHCVCGQQQTRAKIWENIPERRIEWHLVVCVLNPKSQRI